MGGGHDVRRVVGRQLQFRHGVDIAADVVDAENTALVGEIAGQVTVIPQHEDGSFAGLLRYAAPRIPPLRLDGISRADEGDLLAVAQRQYHSRVAVLRRSLLLVPGSPYDADIRRFGRSGNLVDDRSLSGRQVDERDSPAQDLLLC